MRASESIKYRHPWQARCGSEQGFALWHGHSPSSAAGASSFFGGKSASFSPSFKHSLQRRKVAGDESRMTLAGECADGRPGPGFPAPSLFHPARPPGGRTPLLTQWQAGSFTESVPACRRGLCCREVDTDIRGLGLSVHRETCCLASREKWFWFVEAEEMEVEEALVAEALRLPALCCQLNKKKNLAGNSCKNCGGSASLTMNPGKNGALA